MNEYTTHPNHDSYNLNKQLIFSIVSYSHSSQFQF